MGTLCETCGDEGFVEAFVYCDACKIGAVHRYCCGITPVPIDDYVIWFCSECEGSDTGFECKEVDQVGILTKSEKKKGNKKKKKKKKKISNPPVLKVEYHELQDSSNVESVEVTSAPPVMETVEEPERREVSGSVESNELTGLVGNEASASEAGDGASVKEKSGKEKKKKKKKRKRQSIDHSLPDATNVEPAEASKKQDDFDTGKSDELTGLASNEISVLGKSEKKKKKMRNEESSNRTSPVLEAEGHGLLDTTNVEATKPKSSDNRESEESNGLVRTEVSVLEKREKKKKKKKTNKEEEKKNEESSYHTSPVLDAEDHGLQDASSAESMKESKKQETTESRNSDELNGLGSNEVSVLEKSEKKKKKKKKMTNKEEEKKNEESSNHNSPVLVSKDHGLRIASSAESMKESKKRKTTDSRNSEELNGLASKKVSVLEKSEKKKKKKKMTNKEEEKKNEESCNHTSPVLDAEDHGLRDAISAELMTESKKQKTSDSRNSDELNGLVRNEVSVLKISEKNRKKKKKTSKEEEKKNEESSNHRSPVLNAENHGLQDATSAEPMESKKRKTTDNRNSDELNGLARKEVSVLEKTEKKKKKKTNKEEEKKNEESCTHTSPVLDSEDHRLQDANSAEPMKESKKQKTSDSRNSVELNDVATNEVSILEKSEKKKEKKKTNKEEEKKNKESSNHNSPVLVSEDHGLQDATSAEPMKESKKQKTSDSRNFDELNSLVRNEVSVLEKSAKKKETNKEEESSNHTLPVLAVKDNGVQDTINVEPAKAQESSASGKPHELVGLTKYAASVSEGGNSSTVPDHNSCTTGRKRRLSSGNIRVTSENTELAAANSSCKEAESNMPQTNGVLTATDSPVLNNDRALPIFQPIWRGSIYVKQGSICSIDRLDAHLSSLACHKVHEKASSLQARLSAEMFPRLEIWPESFLKNGPPTDESIALYFFPSRDSKDEKVYSSLVDDMKNDDLAMRCVLDNVELLIFTSYQLPMNCWTFNSKEYLWGIFRRRKTPRH